MPDDETLGQSIQHGVDRAGWADPAICISYDPSGLDKEGRRVGSQDVPTEVSLVAWIRFERGHKRTLPLEG